MSVFNLIYWGYFMKPTYEELQSERDALAVMHIDNVRHIWESRNCGSCEELADKHDALAAQVELFTTVISERFTSKERQPDDTVITDGAPWALALLRKTPATCLAQVKAGAGRDGFIAGVEARRIALLNDKQAEIKADQYAERIRKEVV